MTACCLDAPQLRLYRRGLASHHTRQLPMRATVAAQLTPRLPRAGTPRRPLALASALFVTLLATGVSVGADNWPEWRGLHRDGRSAETGLTEKWTPSGMRAAGET